MISILFFVSLSIIGCYFIWSNALDMYKIGERVDVHNIYKSEGIIFSGCAMWVNFMFECYIAWKINFGYLLSVLLLNLLIIILVCYAHSE